MGLSSDIGVRLLDPLDHTVLPPLSVKSSELKAIKTELTQIKSNIDSLLGRVEQMALAQKANQGRSLRVSAQLSVSGTGRKGRSETGVEKDCGFQSCLDTLLSQSLSVA